MRLGFPRQAILVATAAALLVGCDTGNPQTGTSQPNTGNSQPGGEPPAAPVTGAIEGTAIWTNIDCGVVPLAGCAPPPITVTVTGGPNGRPASSWHGPEGHYRIEGLPPGTYSVGAQVDAAAPGNVPGIAGSLVPMQVWGSFGTLVPVQAGLTTPGIDITLQPPDALCVVVYQGHDATVMFKGPGAQNWCTKLPQLDGNWFKSTALAPAAGLDTICSGSSRAGVVWSVFDSTSLLGSYTYGRPACALINQLAAL